MRKTIVYLMAAALIGVLAGCNGTDEKEPVITDEPVRETKAAEQDEELKELTENTIDAVITLTDGSEIQIELYPDIAPKTVANFVKNVQEGFYTDTIFHRAIKDFVVQGGGYDTEYKLKSVSETVEGEFEENGIDNPLSHTRGVISMARVPSEYNSASTQFFIVQGDSTYLDGQYAAFGKVTDGMDIVDEIADCPSMEEPPAGLSDVPETQYVIESITINSDVDLEADENDKPDNSEDPSDTERPKSTEDTDVENTSEPERMLLQ